MKKSHGEWLTTLKKEMFRKASLNLFCLILLAVYLSIKAQPTSGLSARELDALLQDYAFRAFVRPKTGVPYDGEVPSNLTGIHVGAMRLRSGSLRRYGVSSYKEFHIPVGVTEQPYVVRLVLVYHNLGNWSELYYPLPGYTYLAPVLGLLAYDGSDLSAKNLLELDIRATQVPIRVNFSSLLPASEGMSPKCVYFGLDGSVEFDNVIDKNVCETSKQGHFSIAVEFAAPVPIPAPAPAPSPGGDNGGGREDKRRVWIIVGCVLGGLALFVSLCALFACLRKCGDRRKIQGMETTADRSVPLLMATVGDTKAPIASQTRTRPVLENDYVF